MGKIDVSNLNFERLEPQISEAARLMEMLSHPARLRILCTMLGGEKKCTGVGDQCEPVTAGHVASFAQAARLRVGEHPARQANHILFPERRACGGRVGSLARLILQRAYSLSGASSAAIFTALASAWLKSSGSKRGGKSSSDRAM